MSEGVFVVNQVKFIYFQCQNASILNDFGQKASKLASCEIVELGFKKMLFLFFKDPLSIFFDRHSIDVYKYYQNNFLKGTIRLPSLFFTKLIFVFYDFFYKIKTRLLYGYLENCFKKGDFDAVIMWGGSFSPQTILIDLCKAYKKKTLFFENSPLPKKIQADIKGVNYRCSLSKDPNFYKSINFREDEVMPLEIGFRRSKVKFNKKFNLPKEFIFVPFQVPNDSQILDFSPWIKDMRCFYDVLLKSARKNPKIHFVIKEHPNFRIKLCNKVETVENIIFANAYDTKDLIENSQAVMTINSSAGVESLVLSKKVIVLGLANYSLEGLVLKAQNEEELNEILLKLNSWCYDEELRVSFLKFFYNRFLVSGDYRNLTNETVEKALKKMN